MDKRRIHALTRGRTRIVTTLVCCGLVALFVHVGVGLAQALRPVPKVLWKSETLRFTGLSEGQEVPFSLAFRNVGRKPLRIELGRVSCACVIAKLNPTELAPGGVGRLSGVVSARGSLEDVLATIRVNTNDPAKPVSEIVIKGDLRPSLLVKPTQLSIYPNPHNPGNNKAPLMIANQTDAPVHVFDIVVKEVEVTLSKTDFILGPYEKTVVDVEADPLALVRQRGELLIREERPGRGIPPVNVDLLPSKPMTVSPRKLNFGIVNPTELQQKRPVVVFRGDALSEIGITDVQTPPFIELEQHDVDPEKNVRSMSFRFTPHSVLGVNEGVIQITLEDRRFSKEQGELTQINVPVSAIVTETLTTYHPDSRKGEGQ